MIRAGRRAYVQTRDKLAEAMGMPMGTFRNKKPYAREDHPAPISSDGARVLLWDSEQTLAYREGRPVPELPTTDSDDDLLDRQEAAAAAGVSPKTWDGYKKDQALAKHMVDVGGVEHWPRRAIRAYRDRPGPQAPAGRPTGSGDMVPRDALPGRIAQLLDDDPAVTIATVTEELGISATAAKKGLVQLRGERIADLLEAEPGLTPEQAAERLGYPAAVQRAPLRAAALEQRARQAYPYLQNTADALAQEGLAPAQEVQVQRPADGVLAAAVVLESGPVPALVWDERYGWRTAVSRRHPIGKDTGAPPEGDGIRYLGSGQQPAAEELLAGLADGRRGSVRPRRIYPAGPVE
ncbi:DUF6292 family protein [Streptomyces sp. NPDC021100]|uniref:DUF6292 family protein n=1 Tax=Streptomyces sp. NPDC021100 TaxID=3365114 RepID=UPI0037AFA87B